MDVKRTICMVGAELGVIMLTGVGIWAFKKKEKAENELVFAKSALELTTAHIRFQDMRIKRLEEKIQELKANCKEKES